MAGSELSLKFSVCKTKPVYVTADLLVKDAVLWG